MSNNDTHADIYQTNNPNNWGSTTVEMTFSKYGGFKQLEDNVSGTKIKAEYDDRGLPEKIAVENKDDSFYDVIIKNEYDQAGKVTSRTYEQENEDTDVVNYTYQDEYDGKVVRIDHSYVNTEHIDYDNLQRVSRYGKSDNDICVEYTYTNGNNAVTSNLIASERHTDYNEDFIDNYAYEYDTLGRLTKVINNDILVKRYYYDLVGRLIREDNKDFNKTFEYVYDKSGNILKRNEYAYTEGVLPVVPVSTFNYTYDTTHKNRLLSYNGELCSNYVLGNPNTYRGKTAVWTKVHRLASLGNVSFEYDYAGIRTKKTVNGITTKYGINGSTIVSEQKGANTTRINYYYGHDGVTGFKYLGNCYYYKKNFLGDIIGIYNESGDLVAKYVYDAWGNHKVLNANDIEDNSPTFIGNINPFRYRSYYFDVETGFYYLQSRYYDPEIGRFISMDQVEYLAPDVVNGLNLYVYCLNNPVMGYDPEGCAWWHWAIAVVAVAALAVATCVTAGGALAGAAAISAAAVGVASASATTTVLAFATVATGTTLAASAVVAGINAVETGISTKSMDEALNTFTSYGETALYDTAVSAVIGTLGGYASYKEQIGNKSQAGIMSNADRAKQRNSIWKSINPKTGKRDPGMVIHHPYGCYGNNRNYYQIITEEEHKKFHSIYGYKTNGGQFVRHNPNMHNFWEMLFNFLGI